MYYLESYLKSDIIVYDSIASLFFFFFSFSKCQVWVQASILFHYFYPVINWGDIYCQFTHSFNHFTHRNNHRVIRLQSFDIQLFHVAFVTTRNSFLAAKRTSLLSVLATYRSPNDGQLTTMGRVCDPTIASRTPGGEDVGYRGEQLTYLHKEGVEVEA